MRLNDFGSALNQLKRIHRAFQSSPRGIHFLLACSRTISGYRDPEWREPIYEWTAEVAQSTQVLETGRREALARLPRRALVLLAATTAIAAAGGSYIATRTSAPPPSALAVADVHPPGAPASVVSGSPAAMAAEVAHHLFTASPVVVVANGEGSASMLALAATEARRAAAPMLLTSTGQHPGLLLSGVAFAEIKALHPDDVLAVGVSGHVLAAELAGTSVVTSASALPATTRAGPLRHVALLVPAGRRSVATVAAIATADAAGVQVIPVREADPRADSISIKSLARSKPDQVLALGGAFGTAEGLAAKVAVAETGVQLPGGGQILFPGHRLVCLYGSPGTPALGALGEQNVGASIGRIRKLAATYRSLSRVPVVPAFEILATVAESSPGRNGLYSHENSVASLRPWVRAANKAGLYVILDLQAGRANLLAQAEMYRSLLKLPDVGLALDPEWKLRAGQLPLRQIGSVSVSQVNSVITWLAALTTRYRLPQKVLVLHQFQPSMIQGESRLETGNSDLAIVIHMDGQGSPSSKQQTWDAIVGAAPPGVFFGWKNFFVKDHPMLDPRQTMRHWPQPVMISYE
jgi:hypothetical protein